MDENITSQTEGTNSDEVDEVTAEVQTEDTQEGNAETKATNNFKKILSEKNEYKREVEDLKAKLSTQEFWEDKVASMIQQAVAASKAADLHTKERNHFLDSYGEEELAMVETTLESHPSLSYEQAAKISGINTFEASNPNKFSMPGQTPASIKQKKTIKDASDEDLMEWAAAELRAMWLHNA